VPASFDSRCFDSCSGVRRQQQCIGLQASVARIQVGGRVTSCDSFNQWAPHASMLRFQLLRFLLQLVSLALLVLTCTCTLMSGEAVALNGHIIATSIVHSKLDYCNSLYYNLPKSQIHRLQQIQAPLLVSLLKLLNLFTPLLFSNLFAGLK